MGAALDLRRRLPLTVDLALEVSESDPHPATASLAHCCWFPSQQGLSLAAKVMSSYSRPNWANSMRKRSKTSCMSLPHSCAKCRQQTGGLTKRSCLDLTLFVTPFSLLLAQGFGFTFGKTSPAYSQCAPSSVSKVHDNLASFPLGKCPLH